MFFVVPVRAGWFAVGLVLVALWEVVKWLGRLLLALADIVVPRRRQYGVRVGGVCGRRHYGNRLQPPPVRWVS